MVCPYNKNQWTTDTHNMAESQNMYAEKKKPNKGDYILYESIHMKL